MDRTNESSEQVELLRRAHAGDLGAVRRYFGGYVAPVYDFAFRLTAAVATAEEVTEAALQAGATRIREGAAPAEVRTHLYTAATETALQVQPGAPEIGVDLSQRLPVYARFRPGRLAVPHAVVRDAELAEVVWRAGLAQGRHKYAALSLRFRHGFSTSAIAAMMGVPPEQARAQIAAARSAVGDSVTRYLIGRYGAAHCGEYRRLLLEFSDSTWVSAQRRELERHLGACPLCQAFHIAGVSPMRLLAALARTRPTAAFRDRLLLDLCLSFFPQPNLSLESGVRSPESGVAPLPAPGDAHSLLSSSVGSGSKLAETSSRVRIRRPMAGALVAAVVVVLLVMAGNVRANGSEAALLAAAHPPPAVSQTSSPALEGGGSIPFVPSESTSARLSAAGDRDNDLSSFFAMSAAIQAIIQTNGLGEAGAASGNNEWHRIPMMSMWSSQGG